MLTILRIYTEGAIAYTGRSVQGSRQTGMTIHDNRERSGLLHKRP